MSAFQTNAFQSNTFQQTPFALTVVGTTGSWTGGSALSVVPDFPNALSFEDFIDDTINEVVFRLVTT